MTARQSIIPTQQMATKLETLLQETSRHLDPVELSLSHFSYKSCEKNNNGEIMRNYRQEAIHQYGYAIITEEVINIIKTLNRKMFEVGAGSGYLSYELQQVGVDIIATDIDPCNPEWNPKQRTWTTVKKLSAEQAVKRYQQGRIMLICWPDPGDWAYKTLSMYTNDMFVYIGEVEERCMANADFFNLLRTKWNYKIHHTPTWQYFYDCLIVCTKKPARQFIKRSHQNKPASGGYNIP